MTAAPMFTASSSAQKDWLQQVNDLTTPEYLKLIVMPTEQCNFRCTYCYEDYTVGKMPRPIIDAVKALLTRRAPQLKVLHLEWFGGEPLMARDIVLEITQHAHSLALEYQDLEVRSGMTTNAWHLSDETFQNITRSGLTHYQITLDGPQSVHDLTRRRGNGKGTFDQIYSNLLNIRRSTAAVDVMVRVHVSPDNVGRLEELIDDLRRDLLDDQRFHLHFHAIGHWGGGNDHTFTVLDEHESQRAIRRLMQRAYEGLRPDALIASPATSAAAEACYAAKSNSFVVRSDGRLAKCTLALRDTRNSVGHILPDGRLSLDQETMRFWLRGINSLDRDILRCPAHS